MKVSKRIKFPVKLGKKKQNFLHSQEGKIEDGRWIDLNSEEDDKDPEWKRAKSTGSLVDRSIGGKRYATKQNEYAIFTYYGHPSLQMPLFDLLPIDSPLFDMDSEPAEVEPPSAFVELTPPRTLRLQRAEAPLIAVGMATLLSLLLASVTYAERNP